MINVNLHGASMKMLLRVETYDGTDVSLDKLQVLHDNLAEELCGDLDAQTNNDLFIRYVRAYTKLQRLLVEFHERSK
jgi:hypothetical protein